jgi:Na+/proline symporter
MKLQLIDFSTIVAYLLATVCIGIYYRKKAWKDNAGVPDATTLIK